MNEVVQETRIILPPKTKVRVTEDHLLPAYRGDTGTIERVVGFEKYYVLLKKHGRTMVHEKNLEVIEEGVKP